MKVRYASIRGKFYRSPGETIVEKNGDGIKLVYSPGIYYDSRFMDLCLSVEYKPSNIVIEECIELPKEDWNYLYRFRGNERHLKDKYLWVWSGDVRIIKLRGCRFRENGDMELRFGLDKGYSLFDCFGFDRLPPNMILNVTRSSWRYKNLDKWDAKYEREDFTNDQLSDMILALKENMKYRFKYFNHTLNNLNKVFPFFIEELETHFGEDTIGALVCSNSFNI